MSFDDRDVRRGMDVFTLDNVLVGTVVWIRRGRTARSGAGEAGEAWPTSGSVGRVGLASERGTRAPLATEMGAQVSTVNGEALGPMPTAGVGNGGPRAQGALTRFASGADRAGRSLEGAELVVMRTPIGLDVRHPLPRVRRVPLAAVQTVSLERIILRVTEAELDAGRR